MDYSISSKSFGFSMLFQLIVLVLVCKYSMFYIVMIEIWVVVFFIFIFIVFEGGVIFLCHICVILSFSFVWELGVLFLFYSELEVNLVYFFIYSLFNQVLLILLCLVFKLESFSLGYVLYVFNSNFVYMYYIMIIYSFSNLNWYIELICGSKVVVSIVFLFWYCCFYIFIVLMWNSNFSELVLGFIIFSQCFFIFSLIIKFKYFFLCFWLDSLLFLFYFFYICNSFGSFTYIDCLGCLNYYFYFVFFTFLFSLPPFPGFFIEISFLLWVYFLFNSFYCYLVFMNLFCFLFVFFTVLLKIVFSGLVLDMSMVWSVSDDIGIVYCFLGVLKLYEMWWVLQVYF